MHGAAIPGCNGSTAKVCTASPGEEVATGDGGAMPKTRKGAGPLSSGPEFYRRQTGGAYDQERVCRPRPARAVESCRHPAQRGGRAGGAGGGHARLFAGDAGVPAAVRCHARSGGGDPVRPGGRPPAHDRPTQAGRDGQQEEPGEALGRDEEEAPQLSNWRGGWWVASRPSAAPKRRKRRWRSQVCCYPLLSLWDELGPHTTLPSCIAEHALPWGVTYTPIPEVDDWNISGYLIFQPVIK